MFRFSSATFLLALLLLAGFILIGASAQAQFTRFVSTTGTMAPASATTSWATSTTDLQGAIDVSQPGDQVWVDAGVYKPGGNTSTDRTLSFSMKKGVAIYGGFAGQEMNLNSRSLTFPSSTSLSGDLGTPGSTPDNSYHVVSNPLGLTTTAVLDGFVITGECEWRFGKQRWETIQLWCG